MLPPGHAPGQERLAALSLKNTAERNSADATLAPAQAIVDAAMKMAQDRGDSARAVGTIADSTCQLVADRIKTGGALDAEMGWAASSPVPTPRNQQLSR